MDIITFQKKNNELLQEISELQGDDCTPIPDGVIDIAKYLNTKTKILWINKEVNSLDDTDEWSLIDVLFNLQEKYKENKDWSNTFSPIVYTLYGIFNNTNWENTPNIKDNSDILNIIRNIAYINVKKLPGGPLANQKNLLRYSRANDILKKQIILYSPDVIVCGGTFDIMDNIFDDIYGKKYDDMKQIEISKKNRIFYDDKLIIFEAYHPGQRKLADSVYCDSISQNFLKWQKEKRLNKI